MPNHSWSRKSVFYQIYPLSFKDSNGDGRGDLQGILEKLDYLNDGSEQSLGIDALWLSPVYKSPMADFGYDISDYRSIDAVFGDMEAFERLLAEVHRRGMKLVMDFVPNHTSSEHPWFLESRSSLKNSKRDWYLWHDPKPDGSPPNNWLSVFGGSGWTLDEKTGQYYFHTFLPQQPDLNWRNLEVREAMMDVLRFWLKKGVDGFRTDSAYHLIKDGELRDDPPNPDYNPGKSDPYDALLHIHSQDRPKLFETTNALCEVVGAHGDKFMISEAYLALPAMMQFYHACRNGIHHPFNFNLITMPWEAGAYKQFVDEFEASLDEEDFPNYVLGNHDRSRVASRLGDERARLAAFLLLTLRGMPFIYYGDEIGMKDAEIPPEKLKDPLEKRVPGFHLGRDPERAPMQWNSEPQAGFSKGEPWLQPAKDYKERNVERELRDPKSILSLYRRLIHGRKKSPALLSGKYVPVESGNNSVFAFMREEGDERALVLINFSDKEERVSPPFAKGKISCNSFMDAEARETSLDGFRLRPYEGYLLFV